MTPVTLPSAQLLAFAFSPGAAFEGQLVGALERLESGGALRVLDVLFVAADEATGELVAINLQGGTGGLTAKLLDFRLDPAARRRTAERALEDDPSGGTAQLLRDLGKSSSQVLHWRCCSSSTSGPEEWRMPSRASAAERWRASSSTRRSCLSWRPTFSGWCDDLPHRCRLLGQREDHRERPECQDGRDERQREHGAVGPHPRTRAPGIAIPPMRVPLTERDRP
jgi:hypothetical protein